MSQHNYIYTLLKQHIRAQGPRLTSSCVCYKYFVTLTASTVKPLLDRFKYALQLQIGLEIIKIKHSNIIEHQMIIS